VKRRTAKEDLPDNPEKERKHILNRRALPTEAKFSKALGGGGLKLRGGDPASSEGGGRITRPEGGGGPSLFTRTLSYQGNEMRTQWQRTVGKEMFEGSASSIITGSRPGSVGCLRGGWKVQTIVFLGKKGYFKLLRGGSHLLLG